MRKIARFTVSVALFFETARAKRPSSTAWVANGYHVFTPHCPGGSRSFSKRTSFAPRTRDFPAASTARRRQSVLPLGSTAMEDHDPEAKEKSLFIFGVGYVATAIALTFLRKGWTVHGTCTDPRKVRSLGDQGIKAYIFDDWSGPMMQPEPLEALASATCILSTVPPALQSGTDPVLVAHAAELRWAHRNGSLKWVGYLSSTGVYGDRGGGWVTEEDEPWPSAPRTKARLMAERSWLRLHERDGLPAHVFRLAGIYGPGRSALDAVARHSGDIRLAGSDDGTMVSRIHASDIVGVVETSVESPEPGMILNVADDLPSTRYETLAFGCKLLGYPRQDPDPSEKYVNRRGGGNKRVDNSKMRNLLAASGRSLVFPDYRVGLQALHHGDGRPFVPALDPFNPDESNANVGATPGLTGAKHDVFNGKDDSEFKSDRLKIVAELREVGLHVGRLEKKLDRIMAIVSGEVEARATNGQDIGSNAATINGIAASEDVDHGVEEGPNEDIGEDVNTVTESSVESRSEEAIESVMEE